MDKKHAYILVFFGVGIVFTAYIANNLDYLCTIFSFSWHQSVVLFFLVTLSIIIRGCVNTVFYRQLDVPLSIFEGIGLAIINTLGNLLPLSGGMVAKGVYLKKRYNLTFSRYMSATVVLTLCFVSINGFASLLCLSILSLNSIPESSFILFIAFFFMSFAVIFVFLPMNIPYAPKRLSPYLVDFKQGWSILRGKLSVLIFIFFAQIVGLILIGIRLWMFFSVLSIETNLLLCVILAGALSLTSIANIVPGNIGVREGLLGGITFLMGHPFGLSALVVGFDRVFSIFSIWILAMAFSVISKNSILKST